MKITSHTKPMSKPLTDFIAIIVALSLVFLQVPLLKFAQVAQADSDSAAVATQAQSVDVGVSFDHAYIEYSGQVVAPPAKKITLPAGTDLVFEAVPDSGYEISEVTADLGGSEVDLAPNSKGQYKIGSGSLAAGASISVSAVAIPEPVVVEPEPEPEPEIVEEAVVEEAVEEPAAQDGQATEPAKAEDAAASSATSEVAADAEASAAAAQPESSASAAAADADASASAAAADASASAASADADVALDPEAAAAADAEAAAAAAAEAEAAAAAAAAVNTQTEYVFSNSEMTVTATLSRADAVPANAIFQVKPITVGSAGYNYDVYMQALNDSAPNIEYTTENTLLFDVAFMVPKTDAEGNEIPGELVEFQPEAGTVSFTFQFNKGQLSKAADAEGSTDVSVIHLPLTNEVRSTVDSTEDATNIYVGDVIVEEVAPSASVKDETVSFTLNSLSTTVVTTATPNNMTSTNTLTATETGVQTSSDLSRFLTEAIIDAPTNDAGEYIIVPNTLYKVSLAFAETPTLQFPNDGTSMVYELPTGLDAVEGASGTLTIKVNDGGTFYSVPGNTYTIEGGKLYFSFNTTDPNFPILAAANNAKFNMAFDGMFLAETSGISFSDGISCDFEVNTAQKVTVLKSSSPDSTKDTVTYTVTVRSDGANHDVVVTDAIAGDLLKLNSNSFTVKSSKSGNMTFNGAIAGNSFTYTIPAMSDGEVVTITYTAAIDYTKLPNVNGKRISTVDNTVSVKSDEDPTPDETTITTTIDYTVRLSKKSPTVLSEDGNKKILEWTVILNEKPKVSAYGSTVTDTIRNDMKPYMRYIGTGINVKVYDVRWVTNHNIDPIKERNYTWEELTPRTDTSWTYTVPEEDAESAYVYVITYQTEVDLTGRVSQTKIINEAKTNGGRTKNGSDTYIPAGGEVLVAKSVKDVDVDNMEITWKATFNVPKDGLTQAELKDTIPHKWLNGKHIYEGLVGSVEVEGLLSGESYSVHDNSYTNGNYFRITFYQDEGHQTPGLKAGEARTITVTFKTKIDEDWFTAGATDTYFQRHENSIRLTANGQNKTASVEAIAIKPSVNKTATYVGTRNVNGVELPIYRYEIVLANTKDNVNEVIDHYDTSLLEPYVYNEWDAYYVFGGGIYSQDTRGGHFNYVFTDDGIQITTTEAAMPHNDSESGFYDKYKLVYYLTVKDAAALNTIIGRAAADENGICRLGNTAEWNGGSSEAYVEYKYKGLTKELVTPQRELEKTDEDIWAEFRITLNPSAQTLNGGAALTMTDTFNNLSIDYESISATPSEGVKWDVSGNTATYTIPDSTKVVITYKARVTMMDIGEAGDTKHVTFSNEAVMNGYTSTIVENATRHNDGNGSASVPVIKLMKYEAGDMQHKLSGAQFQLLDSNKKPILDKAGNTVVFTTPEDGIITIRGDQENLGWVLTENTRYYLRELVAPPGYTLAGYDFSFQISADGSDDYAHYIYHSGDTMTAKNYKGTDVRVLKSWTDGNDEHDDDTITVKLQQKVGNGQWSDVIREEVKNDQDKYVWVDTPGKTVTLNVNNDWEATFASLPVAVPVNLNDVNGEDATVEYRVVETLVNGKAPEADTVTVTGGLEGGTYVFNIENKSEPKKTSATVKKVWDDNNNQDGKRPASITVQLLANGNPYQDEVVLNEDNNWEYTWNLLPKRLKSKDIVYSIAEISNSEGYTVSYGTEKTEDGFNITVTNKHDVEYIDIPVRKDWNDSNNQDGKRPASITANLKVGSEVIDSVELNADNNWSAKFEHLPKYADGELINYAVEEVTVPDYETTITGSAAAGFVIKNDHTTIETEVEATKVWDDANNQDGKRPAKVVVQLMNGDGPVDEAVELNAENNWHYKWEHLPKYANGEEISYNVVETIVPDEYTSTVTGSAAEGFTVTNSYKPGVTSISVMKAWEDKSNQDGLRPPSINVQLQVDGQPAQIDGVQTDVVLNEDNHWTYTWDNLDKMKAGAVINYSVVETSTTEGYTSTTEMTGDGAYTITNGHIPEITSVTVSKKWNDDNDRDGIRTSNVSITLFANGDSVTTATVEPDANGNWSYTFENLPKYSNGKEIVYTIEEAPVEGYTPEIDGFLVNNNHIPEKIDISGAKTWNDNDNQYGFRPESITVNLLADNVKVDSKEVTAENGWAYEFTGLNKYRDHGVPIVYTIEEEATDGYVGAVVNGYNLVNTPTTGELEVSKRVTNTTANTEQVKFAFTVTLDNENVNGTYGDMSFENGIAQFELGDGESAKAIGLPEGVRYTVEEESLDAYATKKTGDTGTIAANTTAQASFENKYQATGEIEFFALKELKGRTLRAGEFSFTLTDDVRGTVETVTNDGDAYARFPKKIYTLEDLNTTFTYHISEVPGNLPGVEYSTATYDITVTLADKGNGELEVNCTGYDSEKGAKFINTYTSRGTVNLSTLKTIDGDKLPEAGVYTFELRDSDGGLVETATNDAQGNVTFEPFEITGAKNREYTITEKRPEGAVPFNRGWVYNNIIYDEGTSEIKLTVTDNFDGTLAIEPPVYDGGTPKVFDNKTAPEGEFELTATKHMTGRSLNANDDYTFTVVGSEGAPMPANTTVGLRHDVANDEVVDFGKITYTTNDLNQTYTYTITESGGQANSGVTNDPFPHVVTVEITDGLDGTLKVTPTYENGSDKVVFSNTYTAEGYIYLTAKKTLDGRALRGGEFFFTATGDKINGELPASEVQDGTVEFAPIRVTLDDLTNGKADFHYTIKETKGTLGGITYDETSYDVTAHVEDNGSGQLVVTYDYGNAAEPPTFKNSYKPEPVSVDLEAYKTLAGGTIADHEFEFTLTETTEGAMNPVSQTKKCDANGVVKFDKITYEPSETDTYPKTYTYTVSENIPQGATNNNDGTFTGRDGITYDGSTHTVTVVVTDDGYGKLLAEVTYDDGQPGISFNNVELVRTGFEFNKYYYGGMGTFNFTMIATDAQRNPRGANPADYSKEKTIVDNGTEAFKATVQNEDFDSGVWKVRFPELSYAADGDYYYLIYEDEASTQDVVVDEAQYFAHVVVSGGQIASTTFNLIYHGVDYNTTSDLSFYNNSGITLGFNSLTTQSTLEDQRVSVYPKAMKYLNGSTAQLVGGDFEFQLIDEQTGELLAAATNDETGNIAFFDENTDPGLVYDKPGTYRYLIREVPGDVTGMIYDNSAILLTVEVTQGEEGLEATTTYNGPAGAEPAFFNLQEGMDLTVQKVSRYGGEGLVDCTYALWMVGESGDVMIAEATSDATGYITFKNVNLMKGQKYYFKEVEAPFGHTVDPYRTAYFALNETGDALVLVEETAADGWHSATENIEVDKAKASEAN